MLRTFVKDYEYWKKGYLLKSEATTSNCSDFVNLHTSTRCPTYSQFQMWVQNENIVNHLKSKDIQHTSNVTMLNQKAGIRQNLLHRFCFSR